MDYSILDTSMVQQMEFSFQMVQMAFINFALLLGSIKLKRQIKLKGYFIII
jgi:hypothetical protein